MTALPKTTDAIDDAEALFDFAALERTPLVREPFDYLTLDNFVRSAPLAEVNRDYPAIDRPGNLSLGSIDYGPAFQALLDLMQGETFARHVGDKFGVDLVGKETTITVRSQSEASDGSIHTDHRSKIVTLLLYFNKDWPHETGKLRFMRTIDDIEDYVAEVTPLDGTMVAFRRTDNSFHGYKRHVGSRRMVQMSWLHNSAGAQVRLHLDRFSTRLMKRFQRLT